MSQRVFIPQSPFKADAHAEELIHARIEACDQAFQSGEKYFIKYAVIALENWILGEGVGDEKCLKELADIETAWASTYQENVKRYKEQSENSLCQDLLELPANSPPLEYYRKKYISMWSLCQRKKMLFRHHTKVEM